MPVAPALLSQRQNRRGAGPVLERVYAGVLKRVACAVLRQDPSQPIENAGERGVEINLRHSLLDVSYLARGGICGVAVADHVDAGLKRSSFCTPLVQAREKGLAPVRVEQMKGVVGSLHALPHILRDRSRVGAPQSLRNQKPP